MEALLINRVGGARDHYIAPIDRCFELVGLIRISWRGLSGGQEVWERIDTFFTDLRALPASRLGRMPDLDLEVVSAGAEPDTLIPILNFRVRISEREGHRVDSISLRCQIMVQATRRTYAPGEQEALLDLFGQPSRWGTTLKTMLWTHASTDVVGFRGLHGDDRPGAVHARPHDHRREILLRARGWRDSADVPVQRHHLLARRRRAACRSRRSRGRRRRRSAFPSRRGVRSWKSTIRTARGSACVATPSTASIATRRTPGCRDGTRRSRRLLAAADGHATVGSTPA